VFNHEPDGYECPFCALLGGGDTAVDDQRDIVLRTDLATAVMASNWRPGNEAHVIVVPNAHHENLYDVPEGRSRGAGGGDRDAHCDDFYGATPEHRFTPLEERLPRVELLRRQPATAG
jgi:hypothetical protein